MNRQLQAGGTHHYVMSEGRRQGAKKPRPINASSLRPQRYKCVSDILSVSVAYTFMTGFAKDDHGSLQTPQASIRSLGKPEEYKIHKAKVREILSWMMRGQKNA